MKNAILISLSLILLIFTFSCNLKGPDSNNGENGETIDGIDINAARIVLNFSDLPSPSNDNQGLLYYVINEGQFYYSNGTSWVPIDLTGPPGVDGTDGAPGTDGTPGVDGTDGTDLTYTTYAVYDNSGDYVGITRVNSYPWPQYAFYITTSTGYMVGINIYPDNYYPMFGSVVYRDASLNCYATPVFLNAEVATAFSEPDDQWYKYKIPTVLRQDADVVLVEQSVMGTETWLTYDDAATSGELLMDIEPIPFTDLGLPPYDPPFSFVLQ